MRTQDIIASSNTSKVQLKVINVSYDALNVVSSNTSKVQLKAKASV